MPDVFIPVDTSRYTDYHRNVVAAGLVNRIAMNYLDRHRAELNKKYPKFAQYKQNFNVTDDIMQELVTLAKDDKIEFNEEQYNRSKPLIMLQIKALIARDLYDMAEYFQVINDDNESFQEALRLIKRRTAVQKRIGTVNLLSIILPIFVFINEKKGTQKMDTTMKTIELTLPDSELPFIKTIAKKFGWTLTTKHTKTQKSLDEGIADIKAGRVREVSTDELKQMMGL